jgi:hypothetical protein
MRRLLLMGTTVAFILAGCEDSKQGSVPVQDANQKVTEYAPDPEASASNPPAVTRAYSDAPVPTYEIVDRSTYDAPIKTQVVLHAVASGTLTEVGLRQLLQGLYDECAATRGFQYNGGKPTHVFIYLYTSQEHFRSHTGQWIAMLSKLGEDSRPETQVRTELIAQLDAKSEVKHGLSESERKEIFAAVVMAEDRAEADAERMYPYMDPLDPAYSQTSASRQIIKQGEVQNALTEKYHAEVAARYGVTKEQLRDISLEGVKKNWPLPERR